MDEVYSILIKDILLTSSIAKILAEDTQKNNDTHYRRIKPATDRGILLYENQHSAIPQLNDKCNEQLRHSAGARGSIG